MKQNSATRQLGNSAINCLFKNRNNCCGFKILRLCLFFVLYFTYGLISPFAQNTINFKGFDISQTNNCAYSVSDSSSEVFILNDTTGLCSNIVDFTYVGQHVNNALIEFTGIPSYMTDDMKVLFDNSNTTIGLNFTGTQDSSIFNLLSSGYKFLNIRSRNANFTVDSNQIELISDNKVLDFALVTQLGFSETGDHKLELFVRTLEPMSYYSSNDTLTSSEFWLKTDSDFSSIDHFSTEINNTGGMPIGLDDIKVNIPILQLNSPTNGLRAGADNMLSGVGLEYVDNLFINNIEQGFVFDSVGNMHIEIPSNISGNVNISIQSYLSDYTLSNQYIYPAKRYTNFNGPVSVLYEDNQTKAFIDWDLPDTSMTFTYKLRFYSIDTSTSARTFISQNTNVVNPEFLQSNLVKYGHYEIELWQYDNFDQAYFLSDNTEFEAQNDGGEQLTLSNKFLNFIGGWGNASANLDYVIFIKQSTFSPYIGRSYLQAFNRGKGFNRSDYPWYSAEQPLLSIGSGISPTNTTLQDPDGDGIPNDPNDDGNRTICLCQYTMTADHLIDGNKLMPGSTKFKTGWYAPEVFQVKYKDKSGYRVYLQTQRTGAAVFRRALTYRKTVGIEAQSLNYADNLGQNPQASPEAGVSTIKIAYNCINKANVANPNNIRCEQVCEVPSIMYAKYCSKIYTSTHNYGAAILARLIQASMVDIGMVTYQPNTFADAQLVGISKLEHSIHCSSTWNPEFWKNYVGILASLTKFIKIDGQGNFDIDWTKINEQNVKELLDKVVDQYFTPFLNSQNDGCGEVTKSACLNGINPVTFNNELIYNFNLIPNTLSSFNIISIQSMYSRILRASVESRIHTSFGLVVEVGRIDYLSNDYIENITNCCVNRRGGYITGSHSDLWVNGPSENPKDILKGYLDNFVVDTYGSLINWSISTLFPYLLNSTLINSQERYQFNTTLEDINFCKNWGYTPVDERVNEFNQNFMINSNLNINIYPNPAENELNIKYDLPTMVERIEVYNSWGELVLSKLFTETINTETTIPTATLPSGMYIIRLHAKNNTISKSFIKL